MNPFVTTVHSADPSAHVWPGDDRLWVYASHDQPGSNNHDTMVSYHVFSSTDLVNWIDYGVVLHLKDVSWALSHMWAIDAVLWKGTYYLVFCAFERATGIMRTGLATSQNPQGPFTDIGFIQGVEWGQDPTLFVDDDGQPYLFWGWGGRILACKLADDLKSAIPGTTVELTSQLTWCFEGPWVHKYQGKYYLSYPGLFEGQWPEQMYYAIADQPLGPYVFKGAYIPLYPGQAGTNHGSIVEYKGRWLAFHHTCSVSRISESRNLMCDYLEYNADGTIKPIVPTKEGVAADGKTHVQGKVVIRLDAAGCIKACGSLQGTRISRERAGFTGDGYVTGIDKWNYGFTVMAQVGTCPVPPQYRVRIRYCAPDGDQRNRLLVNYTMVEDPEFIGKNDRHIAFPQCADWQVRDAGVVTLKEGDNYLRLYGGSGGIDVDWIELEPV